MLHLPFDKLYNPAGTESGSSQFDKFFPIFHRSNAACRLDLNAGSDMFGEKLDILKSGSAAAEAGGGLDIVRRGVGHDLAELDLLLVREPA